MNDEFYKPKYLKYKAKYLNLKQTGGITAKTGTWIYVFPITLMTAMKVNNYNSGILSVKYLSVREINNVLNNIGYECKVGGTTMTIVKSTDLQIAEGITNAASIAGTKITRAASVAGTGIARAASVAGTGIAHAASVTGTGIARASQSLGNKIGESLIKTGESMRTPLPQPVLAPGESMQTPVLQPAIVSGGANQIIQLSKSSDLNDLKSIINDVATKLEVQPNTLCCIAVRMNALTANTIVLMIKGE